LPKPRYKTVKPLNSERAVLRASLAVLAALGIEPRRQNTGGLVNAKGQYVPFGSPGDPDIATQFPAGWGSMAGKLLLIETKREGFTPERCHGKARERFERQLSRLRACNDNGGVGLWTDDAEWLFRVLWLVRTDQILVRIGSDGWPEIGYHVGYLPDERNNI
jgi:hypothetical protein